MDASCSSHRTHRHTLDEVLPDQQGKNEHGGHDDDPSRRKQIPQITLFALEEREAMRSGKAKIKVRRALLYYALKRLGLDTDPAARAPQDQQIVLLNRKAIFVHGEAASSFKDQL